MFDRAGQAIMAKIMENKDAAEALKVTSNPRVSAAAAQVPKGLRQAGGGVTPPLLTMRRSCIVDIADEMRE